MDVTLCAHNLKDWGCVRVCHWSCEDMTQSQEMVKEAVAEVMFVACWAVGVSTGMHKEEKCDVIV